MEGVEFSELEKLAVMVKSLAKTAIEIPVILEIEPDVPLGDAVGVYDVCRAAKFRTINFAADARLLRRAAAGGK
jgi:biopolymer transport protein ExbD